jgi:uncharacterized surface protein with fasciclin (FAS1) repeats
MFRKHVIPALVVAAFAGSTPLAAQESDIVETAKAAGGFETLLAAATAADLVEVLQGDGPYTVFAPTDEAFARIPEEDLQALLANKEALTEVLLYHVVPGKVVAAEVVGLSSAETAAGREVSIEVVEGSVKVGEATVVATDIEASNGIIHVIDRVMLPQM